MGHSNDMMEAYYEMKAERDALQTKLAAVSSDEEVWKMLASAEMHLNGARELAHLYFERAQRAEAELIELQSQALGWKKLWKEQHSARCDAEEKLEALGKASALVEAK